VKSNNPLSGAGTGGLSFDNKDFPVLYLRLIWNSEFLVTIHKKLGIQFPPYAFMYWTEGFKSAGGLYIYHLYEKK